MSAEINHSSRWSRILPSMTPPDKTMARSVCSRPSRIQVMFTASTGRRFLQQRDDFLADAAFRPLPGRLHRDLPGLALLRRQGVQLGLARFLDFGERVVI